MIKVFSDWLRASIFCQVAISAEFYSAASLAGAQTFQVGVTATNGDGFSGKNGFGGTIKNTMTALCDLDCNVIALAEGTDLPER